MLTSDDTDAMPDTTDDNIAHAHVNTAASGEQMPDQLEAFTDSADADDGDSRAADARTR
ncbi:hypothetical protein [Phytoactinopolyspora halotolerans]|uniref:Uncharacterized protein n=1 Tax=Phytoactinopolyspora halotolerans TaxID=1981512 RepID=A0A6L9S9A7_9ACTN|nr:hypothetical protein [Phytoactinopolyspora halotolerans]NEE01204.1 hypothetical protein [Phytoactinopolyspora halotolerans]